MNTIIKDSIVLLGTVDTVLKPLQNLKMLVTSIVGAIGLIVLVKNIMEFATAMQDQDSSGATRALKGIVGGLLMAGIGAVLTFLGFS